MTFFFVDSRVVAVTAIALGLPDEHLISIAHSAPDERHYASDNSYEYGVDNNDVPCTKIHLSMPGTNV